MGTFGMEETKRLVCTISWRVWVTCCPCSAVSMDVGSSGGTWDSLGFLAPMDKLGQHRKGSSGIHFYSCWHVRGFFLACSLHLRSHGPSPPTFNLLDGACLCNLTSFEVLGQRQCTWLECVLSSINKRERKLFASEITGTARGCVHMSQEKPTLLFLFPPPSFLQGK